MKSLFLVSIAFLTTAAAFAGPLAKETVPPVEPESLQPWRFSMSIPGWMPALEGDVGIDGLVSDIYLDPGDLIRHYDMVISFRGEASKGRFGITSDVLYTSLSDGIGTETIVKKLDLQVDQTIAEVALRWRIIEGPRGFLDVVGGVRYVNLFQQAVTQANESRIDEESTGIVDAVSDRLRNAIADLDFRDLIADRLRTAIAGFDPGHPGQVPIGPIGGQRGERLRERVQDIIASRQTALLARVQAVQAATGAAREQAQARLDDLKEDISDDIAKEVTSKLDARAARADDWWDPFIGLRARYNFNDRFYATLRGDIGGFGVGSDLTWQAEGALGCHLTKRIFAEAGYRALSIDYENDGLAYDVIMHGAQLTVGIEF